MAQSSLKATTGSGTQTTTQSPQASVGSGNPTTSGSSVQPGTTTSLLSTDKGGISLQNKSLPVVSLGARQSQVSAFTPPPTRHVNPLLFGFSGLLFLMAVALFWMTARSSKITTE